MANFNSTTKYPLTRPEINYEFVRDYCGTMRGFVSEFSNEELDEFSEDHYHELQDDPYASDDIPEVVLHWIPAAISDLPKNLHFGMGSDVNTNDVSKKLKEYVVFCFKEAAEELRTHDITGRYDITHSKCWRNPDVCATVYEHVFRKHFESVGTKLHNSIECIMASDKYVALNHVYGLIKHGTEYENEVGDILLNTVNFTAKFPDKISDFKVVDTSYFCSGNDYYEFVDWCSENMNKEHKALFRLSPEAMEILQNAPKFTMEELEKLCDPVSTLEDLEKIEAEETLKENIANLDAMTYSQLLSHEEYLNKQIVKCEKKGIPTKYLQEELDHTKARINHEIAQRMYSDDSDPVGRKYEDADYEIRKF